MQQAEQDAAVLWVAVPPVDLQVPSRSSPRIWTWRPRQLTPVELWRVVDLELLAFPRLARRASTKCGQSSARSRARLLRDDSCSRRCFLPTRAPTGRL